MGRGGSICCALGHWTGTSGSMWPLVLCVPGTSHQRPAGLLQPLPKPNGPWSHITLDFVTGLLVSAGKTVILTIADRFSKIPHSLLVQVEHIFQLHGIPAEVVSDRGPQFSSQVWKAFCTTLRAKPCLRSDYHQQTNG